MNGGDKNNRRVLLAGATGLVGRELLHGLLADGTVAGVQAIGRRPLPQRHAKLSFRQVDFGAIPALPPLDEVYIALGTTIKTAGSQEAFRAVDFDASLAVARAARAAGARHAGVVSAMGADARSALFYNRVKGELEEALAGLGFDGLVIARPSFLAGNREQLGQPERGGEKLALRVSHWLRPLIPANYRSIEAAKVARSLLRHVPNTRGRLVLMSGTMQRGA
ncbi:nucleoside-diphosphate sugar epimerase [Ramlibacter sp. G-1-2-2]|uniref:Nucleoside-diphosphate sugar epimerase n=1 Tax=Ramlibacter agri TaxID=2728837 RepID=A0A848H5W7_9BURK|nr:nucleoside-diphosphate sugar epimerase [Ramlibacter agri]NML44909.1 nucleoside-diphosphate sugar epimerase [Ramlibacter agri]